VKVRSLGNTDIDKILDCFLIAFENYFVKMPADHNYYKQRWKVSGVNLGLSYGMFDKEKLVGFIMSAIDDRRGHVMAYNVGTGVIPEYRGRKIVKSIYEYAIPDLIKNGVSKCVLEVITENHIGIKSYESLGFKICKNYKCFNGIISTTNNFEAQLKEITYQDFDWNHGINQELYSWDNHRSSLKNGNYRYFQIFNDNEIESYFVISQDNRSIAQLDILNNDQSSWYRLFQGIKTISQNIKINNIDECLTDKIAAIESAGLLNNIDQYEMELNLVHSC
jgi:ribosomal protein S18 acetylase RimI-like enzyme